MATRSDRGVASNFAEKILLIFAAIILVAPAANAAEQKTFVLDPNNPQFEFLENQFSDNSTLKTITVLNVGTNAGTIPYISIPAGAMVASASMQLTGSAEDIGPTQWGIDIQSGQGALFDNNEAAGETISGGDVWYSGTFTVPEGSKFFNHWVYIQPRGGNVGSACYLWAYNRIAASWALLGSASGNANPFNFFIRNQPISDFLDENNTLMLKYNLVSSGGQTIFGEIEQRSFYNRTLVPKGASLKIGSNAVWNFLGEFDGTKTAVLGADTLSKAIQEYSNNCIAGTICQIPLNLTAQCKGNITISKVQIKYVYAPPGISTLSEPSTKAVTANQLVYVSNLTSFNPTAQNTAVRFYKMPSNAAKCWENGKEKAVTNIDGDKVCIIEDFVLQGDSRAPPLSIWSDAHESVILAFKKEINSSQQDLSETTSVDSWAYISKKVSVTNIADAFKNALDIFWNTTPKVDEVCVSCLGTEINVADGETRETYAKIKRDKSIISVLDGANDWIQDTEKESVIEGKTFVKGNIRAFNSEQFQFNSVLFSANTKSQFREGWVCTQSPKTFDISAGSEWASIDYPLHCSKNNVITKTSGTPVQNTDKISSLSVQYAKKLYTIKNTDAIPYASVLWNGTNDWGTCDACNGTLDLAPGEAKIQQVEWQGDALSESWSSWVQSGAATISSQTVESTLSVTNSQNTEFSDVTWSKAGPAQLSNCDLCNDTIKVPASGSASAKSTYSGDALVETAWTDFTQDGAVQVDNPITAKSIRVVENKENVAFTGIDTEKPVIAGWTCPTASTIGIPVFGKVTAESVCSKSDVIASVSGGAGDWAQDTSKQTKAEDAAYVKGNLKVKNNENINFTNINLAANIATQSRDGWTCAHAAKTFGIAKSAEWSSADFPITCIKNNVITKTAGISVQDPSKISTLSEQYAEKPYTIENKDTILYTSVSWNGTNDWGTCDTCSGSLNLSGGDKITEAAKWHGDVLADSWTAWAQDTGHTTTLNAQYAKKALTVTNNDVSTSFVDVERDTGSVDGFGCVNCNDNIDVGKGATVQETVTASGDVLDEGAGWSSWSPVGKVVAGGLVTVNSSLSVLNTGSLSYADVDLGAPSRKDWACSGDTTGVIASQGHLTTSRSCEKNSAISKDEDSWVPAGFLSLNSQSIERTVSGQNMDSLGYTGVEWSTPAPANWAPVVVNGSFDIKAGEKWSKTATATGDVLNDSYTDWAQDTGETNTLTSQHITKTLSVKNNDNNIAFSSVSWENNTTPTGFGCYYCSGTLNIDAKGMSAQVLLAKGDALEENLTGWLAGSAEANGEAKIRKDLTIKNQNLNIGFKGVKLELEDSREGWACSEAEATDVLAGQEKVLPNVVECTKKNVIEANEKPAIVPDTIKVGGVISVQKKVVVKNNDAQLSYASSIGASVKEAIEGTVDISDSMNNTLVPTTADYENGTIGWNTLSPADSTTEYTIEYQAQAPYYSHKDEKASAVSAAVYSYSANITVPNAYSENSTIEAELSLADLPNWELHNNVKAYVDGKETDTNINNDFLTIVIPPNSLKTGSHTIQIEYTRPSIIGIVGDMVSNLPLDLEVQGGNTTTRTFTAMEEVKFKTSNNPVVSFNYDFNKDLLDIKGVAIETNNTGSRGGVIIRGLPLQSNATKTIYVPKQTTSNKICIADKEVNSIEEIICNGTNDTYLVTCDGAEQNGYICTAIDAYYKVTGLYHSGIREEPQPSLPPKSSGNTGESSGSGNGEGGGSSNLKPAKKTELQKTISEINENIPRLPSDKEINSQTTTDGTIKKSINDDSAPIFTGFMNLITLKTKSSKALASVLLGILAGTLAATKAKRYLQKTGETPRKKVRPVQHAKQKISLPEKQSAVNSHMEIMMKALHPREKEIMRTLMEHQGKATQARVYHATGMPTTSLSRWMDKLEQKGLVQSTRLGKLRMLEVTSKFKGEEVDNAPTLGKAPVLQRTDKFT